MVRHYNTNILVRSFFPIFYFILFYFIFLSGGKHLLKKNVYFSAKCKYLKLHIRYSYETKNKSRRDVHTDCMNFLKLKFSGGEIHKNTQKIINFPVLVNFLNPTIITLFPIKWNCCENFTDFQGSISEKLRF